MADIGVTCMWSRTDRAEFRDIPRSADGPPQISPTLRARPLPFSAAIRSSTTAKTSGAAHETLRSCTLSFKLRVPELKFTLKELREFRNDLRAAKRAFWSTASFRRVAKPELRPNDAISESQSTREATERDWVSWASLLLVRYYSEVESSSSLFSHGDKWSNFPRVSFPWKGLENEYKSAVEPPLAPRRPLMAVFLRESFQFSILPLFILLEDYLLLISY